jgi:uncharacterized protein (DUF2235 family)
MARQPRAAPQPKPQAAASASSPAGDAPAPKTIVVCCDGTGNEIGRNLSNVMKLYRCLEKGGGQVAYYNPGVGTLGQQNPWRRFYAAARRVFGLATGWGLDDNVLDAYRFVANAYADGDRICLIGFSRGAHTVRVVAALIEVVGLLRPEQLNLAGYALAAYKKTPVADPNEVAAAMGAADYGVDGPPEGETPGRYFGRITAARRVPIAFVGVFDTVSSIIVPRGLLGVPRLEVLPFTRRNPSVAVFRQACAIDEKRRLFRLQGWIPGPFNPPGAAAAAMQDARQVWFAGYHADVGGGHPESESALAKLPLGWMIREAAKAGVRFNADGVAHFVDGNPGPGQDPKLNTQVAPDPLGAIHDSMSIAWLPLEVWPKRRKRLQWPGRRSFGGLYLPLAEPRPIADGACVHHAAVTRRDQVAHYRPVNWPARPAIETDAPPDG